MAGWKVGLLAAMALVPVLGVTGCSQPPPLEYVERQLGDLNATVAEGGHSPQHLATLEAVLGRMASRADDYALRQNISRLQSLIRGMQERPERPTGWVAPQPRVEGA